MMCSLFLHPPLPLVHTHELLPQLFSLAIVGKTNCTRSINKQIKQETWVVGNLRKGYIKWGRPAPLLPRL